MKAITFSIFLFSAMSLLSCGGVSAPEPSACDDQECEEGFHCEAAGENAECIIDDPCALALCEAGQHCEVVEVQCIQAPCPAQAQCVDDDAHVSCENLRCVQGLKCVDNEEGPACVALECSDIECNDNETCEENSETGATCSPRITCANVRCSTGLVCVDSDSGPQCVDAMPDGVE